VELRAQEGASVLIRTLCFQRDPSGIDRLAVLKSDQHAIEMKFPESFFSPNTRVPIAGGKVVFHNPANLAGPAIAVASIPAGMQTALILFFPVEADPDKMIFRTSVIDASLKGIPEDGALVMNLYPQDVRVVIGEHRVQLKPGGSAGLARPKERNDYNMSPVVFLEELKGEWKTASETLVRFPEEQRQFFVSYPNLQTHRLSFRAIPINNF
jgi:hypothetical protein